MSTEPYIRRSLWATAAESIDPAAELESWMEELRDVLENREPHPPELFAFSLIALACRLRRVRPNMLDLDPQRDAESRLAEASQELSRQSLEVPNPAAWLLEAGALTESYEEETDPGEQTEKACQLIEDLDDVDLVCWYARTQGIEDHDLDQQLQACHRYLAEEADTFFAASILVQTVGQLLRPDLEQLHPGLARTAEKYRALLDAFVAAEGELDFRDQPLLSQAERQLLLNAASRDAATAAGPSVVDRVGVSWLPADLSLQIAAGTAESSMPVEVRWRSADGKVEAALMFDPEGVGGASETALLMFHHRDSEKTPATELAGEPIMLAGIAGEIDERGEVAFRLGQLRAAEAQPPTLDVGPRAQRWHLCTDGS